MKIIFTILVLIAIPIVAAAQSGQEGPQRYSYHVWGSVADAESRTIPNMTVCFLPSERPINGRIPCTKTAYDGSFAMTVKDTPDKYNVCASTTDSPFLLTKDKDQRVTCSKPIQFGAGDERRRVDLRFEPR